MAASPPLTLENKTTATKTKQQKKKYIFKGDTKNYLFPIQNWLILLLHVEQV